MKAKLIVLISLFFGASLITTAQSTTFKIGILSTNLIPGFSGDEFDFAGDEFDVRGEWSIRTAKPQIKLFVARSSNDQLNGKVATVKIKVFDRTKTNTLYNKVLSNTLTQSSQAYQAFDMESGFKIEKGTYIIRYTVFIETTSIGVVEKTITY